MSEIKLNYKEKRLLSESEQSQKDVEYMVKDAKLQFEADILATQRELDTKKAEFEDAKCLRILKRGLENFYLNITT